MGQAGVWITDLVRYHVLIRVFGGDVDAWIAFAGQGNVADLEFLWWLKRRLTADASLLPRIAEVVDHSGIWPIRDAG